MKYSLLFLGALAWTTAHTATANPPCPSTVWVDHDYLWVNNWAPDDDGVYRVQYSSLYTGDVPHMYTWVGGPIHAAEMYVPSSGSPEWEDEGACTPPPCAPHEVELNDGTCVSCAAGKENPQQGATCTDCAPGKFKAFEGATACQNCPAGKESVSSTECRDCDTWEYSVAGGVCWANGVFEDKIALQNAFLECLGEKATGTGAGCDAGSTHGAMNAWDVSRVTSMSYSECSNRILSLSHLSDARLPLPSAAAVCSLVRLSLSLSPVVFFPHSCLSSSPLSHWSPPLLLLLVFSSASAFNQDISSWDVGKVTTMYQSESSVRSPPPPPPRRRSWCPLFRLYLSLPAALPLPLSPAAVFFPYWCPPLSLSLPSH